MNCLLCLDTLLYRKMQGEMSMEKVWLITGCSKGFGHILVETLLATTSDLVVATARTLDTLRSFEASHPDRVLLCQMDVTREADITACVGQAVQRFGRIDVLVNNAGYGLAGALEECPMDEIRQVFDTNVFGLMRVTKEVLPHMRDKRAGHIINMSSIAGLVAAAGMSLYNSTKFAVEGLSEGLALELADFNIKVTLIEPGPFRTDFAGGSIRIAPLHPDYAGKAADYVRTYLSEMDQAQPGDPLKAARLIMDLVRMETPPLRLLLGNLAVERLQAKTKKQADEFARYETLARSADFNQ